MSIPGRIISRTVTIDLDTQNKVPNSPLWAYGVKITKFANGDVFTYLACYGSRDGRMDKSNEQGIIYRHDKLGWKRALDGRVFQSTEALPEWLIELIASVEGMVSL